MSLQNKITSDEELTRWARKNVPGFAGVISRDQFAHKYPTMMPGSSVIINLDPHYANGGTHWVALRISNIAPLVYYKDSFGAPPPADIVKVIKTPPARGFIYGNRIYQGLEEENCGKRAAYFLRDMARAPKEIDYFEHSEVG